MSKDRDSREDRSLGEKVKTGESLMELAVQALRRYHKAQETQPAEEVEKLRLEAEALFVAVNEYQRQAFGGPAPQFH
jgi:predicted trehalose synthase